MRLVVALQDGLALATDPSPVGARAVTAALVVVGLLAAAAWGLRRGWTGGRTRQALSIETAIALGERRSLVVVTVENRRLLLGMTPQHISLITELGRADTPTFQSTLQASIEAGAAS